MTNSSQVRRPSVKQVRGRETRAQREASANSLGSSSSRGVSLGDVDGDGDLDAFVANGGNQASISGTGVEDANGNLLDGQWTSGQSAPSGNGAPGTQFDFFFNSLPGDSDNSQQVTTADVFFIFASNTFATTEALARKDVDGSGQITTADVFMAFANNTFGLPAPPMPPAPFVPLAANRGRGIAAVDAVMRELDDFEAADRVMDGELMKLSQPTRWSRGNWSRFRRV